MFLKSLFPDCSFQFIIVLLHRIKFKYSDEEANIFTDGIIII